MENPKITWFVNEIVDDNYEFVPKFKHDVEESFTSGEYMKLRVQVWNNRGGNEDVFDAVNAQLVAYFKSYEDTQLLNLCKIRQGESDFEEMIIDIDRAVLDIGTIFGRSNNGTEMNKDNYKEFELQFGPIPSNIRSELKGLILDVEYDN